MYLGTQPFLFHQHLQYRVITEINIITTGTDVTIVEINLTPLEAQEILGIDQSFVKTLLMLNTDKNIISPVLVAIAFNLCSFRSEMFRDCIKLKLSILE